jgi:hypothetical protein
MVICVCEMILPYAIFHEGGYVMLIADLPIKTDTKE